jgi:signal transduction histidine kinase
VSGPTSNLVDPHEPLPALPHPTGAQTQATGPHTFTVGAVTGNGRWRVLATPIALSDGSAGTQLVAQSLSDVQNTVSQLITLFVIIGAAAVVVLAGLGYFLIRASLRPLRDVERTAAMIAAGDLSHRVPDADPRTEVGQLSGALNAMLAEIETAFAQRATSEVAARRSAERMRRSEAAARRSEERMRRFVADASHELRSPLSTISTALDVSGRHPESAEDLVPVIARETARLRELVDDLLMLARTDDATDRPARTEVDLDDIVRAEAERVRGECALDVEVRAGPAKVRGSEAQLRRAVRNLVDNARGHARSRIRVSSAVRGDLAVVEVSDDGPGVGEADRERIFERFVRLDASRQRGHGGTGLGLPIVAGIAARHGGRA